MHKALVYHLVHHVVDLKDEREREAENHGKATRHKYSSTLIIARKSRREGKIK